MTLSRVGLIQLNAEGRGQRGLRNKGTETNRKRNLTMTPLYLYSSF